MQLKLQDVAELFAVDEATVYRWVRDESLPAQLVNQQYHFARADLVEWATFHRIAVPQVLLRLENHENWPQELPQALERGGVHARVTGANRRAVFENVVGRIPGIPESDREPLLTLLLEREAHGSTAIGDGVAIPHPARPVALGLDDPLVALFYLDPPLDLGSIDRKPVTSLFVFITPNVRSHVLLLAQLAAALREPIFRDALRRQAPATEILKFARRFSGHT